MFFDTSTSLLWRIRIGYLMVYSVSCYAAVQADRGEASVPPPFEESWFYVCYQTNRQQKKKQSGTYYWVSRHLTVRQALKKLNQIHNNKGALCVVLPAVGVLKQIKRAYQKKTFSELALEERYRECLMLDFHCLNETTKGEFLKNAPLFESRIARCLGLRKIDSKTIILEPINARVRGRHTPIYRQTWCMGSRLYYNRALNKREDIDALIWQSVRLDESRELYSPASAEGIQPPTPEVLVIDWNLEAEKWVLRQAAKSKAAQSLQPLPPPLPVASNQQSKLRAQLPPADEQGGMSVYLVPATAASLAFVTGFGVSKVKGGAAKPKKVLTKKKNK